MEKYRLNGTKDRCIWCGKSGKESYDEIEFKEGIKSAKTKLVLVCSTECKKELINTEKKYEGKAPLFIFSIIVSLLFGVAGTILQKSNFNFLYLSILGVFILGFTVLFLPFITPQTVQMFGYKKGYKIGKISGFLLLILGFVLIAIIYFSN